MPLYEEQCKSCQYKFEHYDAIPNVISPTCPKCNAETDRLISLTAMKIWESFETRNILPGGRPVTVRSASQLRQLESEHHVKMVDKDAPPPQTIQPIAS